MERYETICADITAQFFYLSGSITDPFELERVAEHYCHQLVNQPNRIDSVADIYVSQINTVGNFRLRQLCA